MDTIGPRLIRTGLSTCAHLMAQILPDRAWQAIAVRLLHRWHKPLTQLPPCASALIRQDPIGSLFHDLRPAF